jgi:KipI family sensor histidine kinase inhibitor
MSAAPRLLPVGEAAWSLQLGEEIDPAVSARVRGVARALEDRGHPWLREAVATYRSLLVRFDPPAREEAAARLLELTASEPSPAAGRLHEIEVRYGGDEGPDLPAVARECRLSEAEVVARHSGREYVAFMLGFLPGFAYLGLLPPELATPRRATPRVRVPAGAVAIAGRQTGVYPFASPGGWNLIGRCSRRLFDPGARPPALIAPGDRVRFHAVDALPDEGPPAAPAPACEGPAAAEVLSPGLFTTVQDRGRAGWRGLGVAGSGAWDAPSLEDANAALGNEPGAAALECALHGPELRFLRAARFAVAGADLGATLERSDLGPWPVPLGAAVLARPGNVLRFAGRREGCRAVIAFEGGIAAPQVLGSRSTDLSAGFGGIGGRPLQGGDRLALLQPSDGARAPRSPGPRPKGAGPLRVILGPQDDAFHPDEVGAFLASEYRVRPESDRVGCRLAGRRLAHRGAAEIVSDGMLPGCIQVPPDGQPIVMGPDGPTTGGYPKIAAVIGADLRRLGQLAPGDAVRFRAVTAEEALRAREDP